MPTIPCPHCQRQISDQSKRCLYCGKPLTSEGGADAEKRDRMLKAMYSAGVGLPPKQKPSMVERLRDEPLLVRVAASIPMIAVGLIWPPLAWKWMKVLFRP